MVRYYGYDSNKSRGMRKKTGSDDLVPALAGSAVSSTAFRKNWARLIHKIYQIDPLQNRPKHLYQVSMRAAPYQIGHTACCMPYLVDKKYSLWRTWAHKKEILIFQ
jgi:hypothetical protein